MPINRLIILISSILISNSIFCQYNLSNPDIATKVNVKKIDLIHLVSNMDDTIEVGMGEVLGQVAPYPEKLSDSYDNLINRSKELYIKKQFEKAAKILEAPVKNEPQNPFILNEYSRALYRIDGKSDLCYSTYKNLIGVLDAKYNNSDSILVVDVWFREAYWKLGTLHMDYGNWTDGFYEINRFLCGIQSEKGEPVYEQALSYLTECAFEMGDFELCEHLANRILFYNPDSDYAKHYLAKIKNK